MADAIDFQDVALLLHEKGWQEFFAKGPHKEPLYYFLVAASMWLGKIFSLPYLYIQKFFQSMLLFSSQIFLWVLLRRLNIRPGIRLMTVLYMGISPALVNAAMSLYSEIVAFPFVLGIVLCSVVSMRAILKETMRKVVISSCLLALAFAGATLGKGIFLYIYLVSLSILILGFLVQTMRGRQELLSRIIVWVVINMVIFFAIIGSFMSLNKKYNGRFELASRYVEALYGVIHKRANPLTPRIFWAHVANIPGEGVCRRFFTEEECRYCHFYASDTYRTSVLAERLQNVPKEQHKAQTLKFIKEFVIQKPFQQLLFMVLEAPKFFFWESTRIGFVEYPPWLLGLFVSPWFKDGLRFCVSLVTMAAFLFVCGWSYRHRREEGTFILLCANWILILATGLYSMFLILTRYALPFAPLFLLNIAFCLDRILSCIENKRVKTC